MIREITTAICLFACTAPALASDEKDDETHADTPSPVLQSLPAEAQKDIEQVRNACREYFTGIGIDPNQSGGYVEPRVSSGDGGLMLFTVSGSQAVIVSDLHLCGDQCIKGATCSTAGGSGFNIYLRTGNAWKNVLSTAAYGPQFLSLDWNKDPPVFKVMVVAISGDSKECPRRSMFIRTYGPTAWKQPCDVIVRWNRTKFTYEPLVRD